MRFRLLFLIRGAFLTTPFLFLCLALMSGWRPPGLTKLQTVMAVQGFTVVTINRFIAPQRMILLGPRRRCRPRLRPPRVPLFPRRILRRFDRRVFSVIKPSLLKFPVMLIGRRVRTPRSRRRRRRRWGWWRVPGQGVGRGKALFRLIFVPISPFWRSTR